MTSKTTSKALPLINHLEIVPLLLLPLFRKIFCYPMVVDALVIISYRRLKKRMAVRMNHLSMILPLFSTKSSLSHWGIIIITIRGNSLRSIPFVMSGHLIFNFFQTLGLPIFNTNPNNGCPKRIYQHSGQAHKHFSHRFHGVSFLADVQTWRSKQKFVFIATNPPQYQNFCTQCTKIITSVSNDIAR